MSSKKFYVDIDLNNNKLNNTQVGSNSLLYSVQGAFDYGTNGLQINDAGTVRKVIHSGNINEYATTATASNGLTKTGNDIQLGGTLNQNTVISGGVYNLEFAIKDLLINAEDVDVITEFDITLSGVNITLQGNDLIFDSTNGAKYANDYSSMYTNRSLVDKEYVDNVAQGLDPKESVRVATTNYIILSGLQTIDGVTVIAGDRVLVKDQGTAGQDNGIYIAAVGAWTRSSDFDGTPANEVSSGAFTFVTEGTTQGDTGWVLATNDPITLGTTSLSFVQFSAAGVITASNGLTKTGNDIQLGGTLTSNINLTGTSYDFTFDVNGFNVTDNGNGMSFSSPEGGGIYFETVSGASNSNIELYGNSMDIYVDGASSSTDMFIDDNSINMSSTDNSTYTVQLNVTNSTVVSKYAKNSMSTIENVHSFQRTSRTVPNAPLVGFGAKVTFDLQGASGGALASPVGVSYSWTDATPGALYGKYSQSVHVSSTPTEIIELDQYGYRYLADYSSNYTDRSLVDKEYVVNAIASASTSGGAQAYLTYKTSITGDNSTTSFPVTHSLNTYDVIVQVYNTSGSMSNVDVGIDRNSVNQITINFGIAPTGSDNYRILITKI